METTLTEFYTPHNIIDSSLDFFTEDEACIPSQQEILTNFANWLKLWMEVAMYKKPVQNHNWQHITRIEPY